MGRPLRLLLLAHGYPPREAAGTEQHVARLAGSLVARGHRVRVLAATRDPARRAWARLAQAPAPGLEVRRIVVNLAARPLAQAERDRVVEAWMAEEAQDFRPDLVHVHHLQFLSSRVPVRAPLVTTLHDAWTWCAAGGLLRDARTGQPCPGPAPGRCAPCAAAWAPRPAPAARALLGIAAHLPARLPPDRVHAAFRLLPEDLRRRVQRPRRGEAPEPPAAAAARNEALATFVRGCAARLAPCAFLARLAAAQGLGAVEVVPHGVDGPRGPPAAGRTGPLLFLGTVAAHKGPDLVIRAWRRAFPAGDPPLAVHGPVQDPRLLLGHPAGGPLAPAEVQAALGRARALVLGSVWPENAPLVVLEARRAGCPVVAPALGGLPELVEAGRDGLLYTPGDEVDLARALGAVLAGAPHLDPRPPPSQAEQVDATEAVYRRVLGGA